MINKSSSYQFTKLSTSESKYYIILFILWPFLAFVTALINYSQREAKKVVFFFLVYFGLTVVLNLNDYVDAVGYALQLRENAALPFSDFFKIIGGLYSSDTSVDIVEPLISFIVSRFTDDYRFLFAAYAAFFGYFYLKSINLLHNRHQKNPGWDAAIHLAFFTIVLPITAINGFRMWTAAWIFFYGAYHVILFRDARYLILTLGASLVHWSFISANVILIIYYLFGNRNQIYFPILLSSFIVPRFITPLLNTISMRLGGALQTRYESYASEDYIMTRQGSMQEASWFLKIGSDLVFFYLIIVMVYVYYRSRRMPEDRFERNLFSFLLLFLSFVNFGMGIPSFGSRFQILFFLFASIYIFLYYNKLPGNKISLLTLIGLFPMLLYGVVEFRQVSVMINAWIVTPGLGLPLVVPGLSMADLLFP